MLKPDYDFELQEDEDLRCPICNYYFSQLTKPYLLPCNHNLCINCIKLIANKNIYECPLCRVKFKEDDIKNLKVNNLFLNLLLRILKTKLIYCPICNKIYPYSEHQFQCPESLFKETSEIVSELRTLVNDSMYFLGLLDKGENKLKRKKIEVIDRLVSTQNEIEKKSKEESSKRVKYFFGSIPNILNEEDYKSIRDFVNLCEPLSNILGLNSLNQKRAENGTKEENDIIKNCFDSESFKEYSENRFSFCVSSDSQNSFESIKKDENVVDKINQVVTIYKSTSDIISRIKNYIRQVEFTTETIKNQINKNYTKMKDKIQNDLTNIYSTIAPDDFIYHNNNNNNNNNNLSNKNIINNNNFSSNISKPEIKINNTFSNIKNNNKSHPMFFDFIYKSKKIWLWEEEKGCKVEEYDFFDFNFNSSMRLDFSPVKNEFFLSGGLIIKKNFFSTESTPNENLYIFGRKDKGSNPISYPLPHQRYNHSSIFSPSFSLLFLIGGFKMKANGITECDLYDVERGGWRLLPAINEPRIFPCLFFYKNKYIYVFGGEICREKGEKNTNRTVEILDIDCVEKGFKYIKIQDPVSSFVPLYKIGAAEFGKNGCIMLVGGFDFFSCENFDIDEEQEEENEGKNKEIFAYTYIYNIISNTIFRSKNLACPAYFSHNGILYCSSCKVRLIDEKNKKKNRFGIHEFNINNNTWSFN